MFYSKSIHGRPGTYESLGEHVCTKSRLHAVVWHWQVEV